MLRLAGRDERRITAGGLLWLIGLEYFVVEAIVLHAAAGYYMAGDTISLLGVSGCHTGAAAFCSPGHALMNAGILISGLTVAGGAALGRPAWPSGWSARAGLALLGLGGIGTIMVGIWPLDSSLGLHIAGAALTLGIGNIGMMLMGFALMRARPVIGGVGCAGGLVSCVAFALFAGHVDFGIGPGTMERIAAYPKTLWLALVGAALVAGALRGRARLAV